MTKKQRKQVETLLSRAELFYKNYKLIYPDSSAPLLGYYFAMNLAKAYLIAKDANLIDSRFSHGLSFVPAKKNIIKTKSTDDNEDIFVELYNQVTNQSISSGTKFKIEELSSGMSDMVFQTLMLGNTSNIIRTEYILLIDRSDSKNQKVWPILRMHQAEASLLEKNKTMLRTFNQYFEKVDFTPNERTNFFNVPAMDMVEASFFQSKDTFDFRKGLSLLECERIIHKSLENRAKVNIFDNDVSLDIFLPLRGRRHLRMNEFLNAYASLYWCSSVVRYSPDISLLGDKQSALGMTFAEINRLSPYVVLRGFLSLFSKREVSFKLRG